MDSRYDLPDAEKKAAVAAVLSALPAEHAARGALYRCARSSPKWQQATRKEIGHVREKR